MRDLSENLQPEVLAAMLNTLPVELSFVDADDRVRYFSHENHAKIFGRTRGAIGRAVLAHLLPERRIRVKTRMIKRSNSKYQARGPNIDRRSYKATIAIDIITNHC